MLFIMEISVQIAQRIWIIKVNFNNQQHKCLHGECEQFEPVEWERECVCGSGSGCEHTFTLSIWEELMAEP